MAPRYSAEEIASAVTSGDSATATRELNADFQNMPPYDFKTVVDRMTTAAAGDRQSSHHPAVEKDEKGNVTAIYMTNEIAGVNVWNTPLFKASDRQNTAGNTLNPAENWSKLNRLLSSALDTPKDK